MKKLSLFLISLLFFSVFVNAQVVFDDDILIVEDEFTGPQHLEKNTDIVWCGSSVENIDSDERKSFGIFQVSNNASICQCWNEDVQELAEIPLGCTSNRIFSSEKTVIRKQRPNCSVSIEETIIIETESDLCVECFEAQQVSQPRFVGCTGEGFAEYRTQFNTCLLDESLNKNLSVKEKVSYLYEPELCASTLSQTIFFFDDISFFLVLILAALVLFLIFGGKNNGKKTKK